MSYDLRDLEAENPSAYREAYGGLNCEDREWEAFLASFDIDGEMDRQEFGK